MIAQVAIIKEVWEVFEITRSRRTNNITYYANLSETTLSNAEKLWACKGVDGELEDDVHWRNLELVYDERFIKSNLINFCTMFSINYENHFRNWFYRNYRRNKYSYDTAGKPKRIDNEELIIIKNKIKDLKYKPNPAALSILLNEAQVNTAVKRGRSMVQIALIDNLSPKAISLYSGGLWKRRKGQSTFQARQTALEDKRALAHWASVLMATMGNLPPYKKFNSDQSMVGIKAAGSNNIVFIACEEEVEAHEKLERLVVKTAAEVRIK